MDARVAPRVRLKSPLPPEQLFVHALGGVESLGQPFDFSLELYSPREDLGLDGFLGENLAVGLPLQDGSLRWFHGIVAEMALSGRVNEFAVYRARLVPWLWLLTRYSDCRVFQGKNAPQIIEQVLRDRGFTDFRNALVGNYPVREYCVQYREDDLSFISRLMEEEGIYYFFEHEESKHLLVLADSISAHAPLPAYDVIRYHPPTDNAVQPEEWIEQWTLAATLQSGKYLLKDYDFTKPRASLLGQSAAAEPEVAANLEQYDYPGGFVVGADGEHYARVRLEALQAERKRVGGSGGVRGLVPGGLFKLRQHPRDDQNAEYLVVSVTHSLQAEDLRTGAGGEELYRCQFEALNPHRTPFRSAQRTPRPLVRGPQTATVVGPGGEEIWTDEHARIKLQFHWDRLGQYDENSSCWVRVASSWAGKSWGAVNIPRIGQEVVVAFLEGNPDRPLVIGSVYNGDNAPPYALPDRRTQSGLKSQTSPGGGGANEIRFEDASGQEHVYVHAQKDMELRVENDRKSTIVHDLAEDVQHDRKRTVGNDETVQVGHDASVEVGNDETWSVGNNRTVTIGKDLSSSIGGNEARSVGRSQSVTVSQSFALDAGSEITLTTGLASITMKSSGEITIKGLKIVLDATTDIEARATAKVDIKGLMTELHGDVSAKVTAGVTAELSGVMTTVKGSGLLDANASGIAKLKGALTMIG